MSEATLTRKGQITIPAEIRKLMAIHPKDRVTFTPMPDGTVMMRAKTKSLNDVRALLQSRSDVCIPVGDMRMCS